MSVDFVSTRTNDNQTRNCARLISAVIARALSDLMIPFSANEIKTRINIDTNALQSVRFFKGNVFLHYAALVGFDGKEFLHRLQHGYIDIASINERNQRTMRARLRWNSKGDTNAKT